jgi:hypothetical protein
MSKHKPDPFPGGQFRPDLSDIWQDLVHNAVGVLSHLFPKFTFWTQAQANGLVLKIAPTDEIIDVIKARREEDADPGDDDYPDLIEATVEFRYYRRYEDALDEQDQEQREAVQERPDLPPLGSWKDLLRSKGMQFEFDWPVLNITAVNITQGPFLNRITKRQFRHKVIERILEEMFENGFIQRRGSEHGPFETLDGERIRF